MKQLRVDPNDIDPHALSQAAAILRAGGVVAYPTDTFYGVAADPRSDAAVRRLFDLKGRDSRSAIALIAANPEQAEGVGRFGPLEQRLAAAFWPGPLTIVVPMAPGMSRLLSSSGTLGVRVPDHPAARAFAAAFGGSITATSANMSGRPAPTTADQVAAGIGDLVDLILDGGPAAGGAPSTIVEIVDGMPTLHRAGATSWERVLRCLE